LEKRKFPLLSPVSTITCASTVAVRDGSTREGTDEKWEGMKQKIRIRTRILFLRRLS
jgi:hypothetical protein